MFISNSDLPLHARRKKTSSQAAPLFPQAKGTGSEETKATTNDIKQLIALVTHHYQPLLVSYFFSYLLHQGTKSKKSDEQPHNQRVKIKVKIQKVKDQSRGDFLIPPFVLYVRRRARIDEAALFSGFFFSFLFFFPLILILLGS